MAETLGQWSTRVVAGAPLVRWLLFAAVALVVAVITRTLQAIVVRRARSAADATQTRIDDVFVDVVSATNPLFHLALGLLVAKGAVPAPWLDEHLVGPILGILIAIQCGLWGQRAFVGVVQTWAARKEGGAYVTMAAGLRFMARLIIWSVVVLVALSNLGVELTAVITGLGVGGVAAALAVQTILGDLIAGVSMYFDRPFDLGDFIIVGDYMGTVSKIGIRSTRVASLGGEEIIFPNGDLVSSRVRNYARMRERRVVFAFGVEYNLPADKVAKVHELITGIIQSRDGVRFDRAHFKAFGASSLDFEVVYYVLSPDYNLYMDHQHAINLELYRALEREGIPFAFPSRTVYLRREATV